MSSHTQHGEESLAYDQDVLDHIRAGLAETKLPAHGVEAFVSLVTTAQRAARLGRVNRRAHPPLAMAGF